ncbi:MAG: hypothetical protein H6R22_404 [Chromatiaceae bacterium]|nr:hypothetical protein [Chromatiaceae bacterium]
MTLAQKTSQSAHGVDLYEADHYAWLVHNAALIRAGRASDVDLGHIAQELEDMGRSEKRALGGHLTVLLLHLLKWQFQPLHRSSSWRGAIYNAREDIRALLKESPSLRVCVPELVADRFGIARYNTANETGLPETSFPSDCPYTVQQLMDPDFWPGVPQERQSGLKC